MGSGLAAARRPGTTVCRLGRALATQLARLQTPSFGSTTSVDRDDHIGGLDHGGGGLAGGELELVHGFVGDRSRDDGAAAEVDANVSGRLPFLHLDDLALENVARAELHADLLCGIGLSQ